MKLAARRAAVSCALTCALTGLLAATAAQASSRATRAAQRVTRTLIEAMNIRGFQLGDPLVLRIFKDEARLEVWVGSADGDFGKFRTYPICTFSGELGPKTAEGDNQAPEGFYSVGRSQLNPSSAYHLAFNLGYPNAFDRANGRTGSALMVHGNCVSIGCFAMGDANIEEIYTLMDAALSNGQLRVPVQVFPFDFKTTRLRWSDSEWAPFWTDLRRGYNAFLKTKRPPKISVVDRRYVVQPG